MMKPSFRLLPVACAAALLSACGGDDGPSVDDQLAQDIQNVVVIYAENRSFDSLYGNFPNAHGLSDVIDTATGKTTAAYVPQIDRDGKTVLPTLPPTWGGVTAAGQSVTVTQQQSAGLANAPFNITKTFAGVDGSVNTRDLYHRFFENQMQINGGKNDQFAAWGDSGGLVMGYFDYSSSPLYKLAQKYTLADNFFQGAFGGSFLNHQYLVCACAPEFPNADTSPQKPSITVVDNDASGNPTYKLTVASDAKASALDAAAKFQLSGNVTPKNYFGDGKYYAVNTMQPPYQPSGNAPAADASGDNLKYANPTAATTLPAQTASTIGDLLTAKKVDWAWYSGSWNAAVKDGTQVSTAARNVIYKGDANGNASAATVDFQPHHHPFNFYKRFDTVSGASERSAHLKDYDDLVKAAAAGSLPAVAFYKPDGYNNQHPGYTNINQADTHISDLVAKLQASPQWKNLLIVVTYDENGGQWDHVAPPKGDKIGPGSRIPAIIISPWAKKGVVDHTPYDTASVLRFITRRWGLDKLPGLKQRDDAIKANGGTALGDLTSALDFSLNQ
ncbi:MAG TPA: acid phosphatase [Burkholderiaceae bacterium]